MTVTQSPVTVELFPIDRGLQGSVLIYNDDHGDIPKALGLEVVGGDRGDGMVVHAIVQRVDARRHDQLQATECVS